MKTEGVGYLMEMSVVGLRSGGVLFFWDSSGNEWVVVLCRCGVLYSVRRLN